MSRFAALLILLLAFPAYSQQFTVEKIQFTLQELPSEEISFKLPVGSLFLSVSEEGTQPTLWVLRSNLPSLVTYRFIVLKGEGRVNDPTMWSRYLGTFDYLSDSYHMFAKNFGLRLIENSAELSTVTPRPTPTSTPTPSPAP